MSRSYDELRRGQWKSAVADYIGQCDDVLQAARERRGGEWPDWLVVPFCHPNSRQSAALCRWLDEIRQKSAKTIRVYYEAPATPSAHIA